MVQLPKHAKSRRKTCCLICSITTQYTQVLVHKYAYNTITFKFSQFLVHLTQNPIVTVQADHVCINHCMIIYITSSKSLLHKLQFRPTKYTNMATYSYLHNIHYEQLQRYTLTFLQLLTLPYTTYTLKSFYIVTLIAVLLQVT